MITLEYGVVYALLSFCIVFVLLIGLSSVIYLFRFFPKEQLQSKQEPLPDQTQQPQTEQDQAQLIAVISAAIRAYRSEQTANTTFIVKRMEGDRKK